MLHKRGLLQGPSVRKTEHIFNCVFFKATQVKSKNENMNFEIFIIGSL